MKAVFSTQLLISGIFLASLMMPVTAAPTKEASPREGRPIQNDTGLILKQGDFDEAYSNYIIGKYFTAFRIALQRGEKGDPTAQTLLGRLYMEGNAVSLDGARAALWFGRAADQGDPQAMLRYGLLLYNGSYVPRDQKKGETFIQRAANAGVPEAYFYYGRLLMAKARDDDEAKDVGLSWFIKGAAAGNPDCAYAAAILLSQGTPKAPRDDNAARKLLETAAAKDHAPAQVELANWMINGRGGGQNYDLAFDYLLLNASRGFTPAQVNVARLYRDGIGVEGDTIKAAAWYMVAQNAKMVAPDLDSMMQGMSDEQLKQATLLAQQYEPSLLPPATTIAKN